jgi:catechol 2,3-dioxygenase-like lactoylglutathione lyase family enzyme
VLGDTPLMAFVATADLARAGDFYASVLGLPVRERTAMAWVFDSHGTELRVTLVRDWSPPSHTVLGWSVADMESTVRGLREKGVALLRFEGFGQDDLGIWLAPSGDRVAWFKDPDGNMLSVTQHGRAAGSAWGGPRGRR